MVLKEVDAGVAIRIFQGLKEEKRAEVRIQILNKDRCIFAPFTVISFVRLGLLLTLLLAYPLYYKSECLGYPRPKNPMKPLSLPSE